MSELLKSRIAWSLENLVREAEVTHYPIVPVPDETDINELLPTEYIDAIQAYVHTGLESDLIEELRGGWYPEDFYSRVTIAFEDQQGNLWYMAIHGLNPSDRLRNNAIKNRNRIDPNFIAYEVKTAYTVMHQTLTHLGRDEDAGNLALLDFDDEYGTTGLLMPHLGEDLSSLLSDTEGTTVTWENFVTLFYAGLLSKPVICDLDLLGNIVWDSQKGLAFIDRGPERGIFDEISTRTYYIRQMADNAAILGFNYYRKLPAEIRAEITPQEWRAIKKSAREERQELGLE
ncbi:MAG: hypothetical protein ACMG6E_01875 [Candidatus Roizmanbacteria bacterium]